MGYQPFKGWQPCGITMLYLLLNSTCRNIVAIFLQVIDIFEKKYL